MKNIKFLIVLIVITFGTFSCTKPTYTLTSSALPTSGGTINPSGGIYEEGKVITLTAQPNNGWIFEKWEGDIKGSSNSVKVTINSNINIIGVFARKDYPLTITITGEGTVQEKVISSPTKSYPFETVVQLTPVPKEGWLFDGWEGDLSGIDYPKEITIDGVKKVTAKFINSIETFGGTWGEIAYDAINTKDGGFIIVGATVSSNGCFLNLAKYLNGDMFVIKYSNNGKIQWVNIFGGSGSDDGIKIIETQDNGYLIVGSHDSDDGNLNVQKFGKQDILVLKLNSNGVKLWSKSFGGSEHDYAKSVVETTEGDYIILGNTSSNDGDFSKLTRGGYSLAIIKVSKNGEKVWLKTFGGGSIDEGYDIVKTHDNDGFIVTGYSNTNFGIYNDTLATLLLKVNNAGEKQWTKNSLAYGVIGNEIIQTKDGNYLIVGSDYSKIPMTWDTDLIVCKVNSLGEIIWRKNYGGSGQDNSGDVIQIQDNGYLITGDTRSNDGLFSGLRKDNGGYGDAFVVKLNLEGEKLWVKTYGGSSVDFGSAIIQLSNGKHILVGTSYSKDGDFYGLNIGNSDIFVTTIR